jgi:hypothetical protein
MSELPPESERYEPRRIRMGCAAAGVLAFLILVAAGVFLFLRIERWPGQTARAVRDAIAEIAKVQPKVTVNNRVYFEQTSPVLELALVSRPTQVERETQHDWLGSSKKIKLRGTYEVKAGFDLTKPFTVNVIDKQIVVEVPPPRILSIEQQDTEILTMENGLWNKVKAKDLEGELRTLPILARQRATETGLQKEALESFKKQIEERFAPEYTVEVRVTTGLVDSDRKD